MNVSKKLRIGLFIFTFFVAGLFFYPKNFQRSSKSENSIKYVEILNLKASSYSFKISYKARVDPNIELTIKSRVSGPVTWVHPRFNLYGTVEKDEVLIKIDSLDYELSLEQARSALEKAKVDLSLALAQNKLAEKEVTFASKLNSTENKASDLTKGIPQLQLAKSVVASAKANLEKAQLQLERTQIKAPFKAYVKEAYVTLGEIVSESSKIADIQDLSLVQFLVFIPQTQRNFFPKDIIGQEVEIESENLNDSALKGKIIGLPQEILTIGSYVYVKINTMNFENLYKVNESSLVSNDHVYIKNSEDIVEQKSVEIFYMKDGFAYLKGELEGKDLITSHNTRILPGQKVSIKQKNE
jgi:multidrug resistance efflux pump